MKDKDEKLTPSLILKMFAETRQQFAESAAKSEKEWREIKEMFAKSKIEAEIEAERRTAESEKEWKEIKESQKETDRILTEKFAETDKQIKATDKIVKELSKNIGGISNSNGKMAEEMIYNMLDKDKTFANVKFDYLRKNVQIQSETYETKTELDILLVNGDTISIIETKYKVEKNDVIDVIDKKLNYFRQYNPKFNNYKVLLGIGGMSFENDAITTAKEKGIGIIKIVGDKVEYQTENVKIY